jgi:phosphoribosylglycinamide formyltransferase-1
LTRIAVFASGRGSNFRSLARAAAADDFPGRIELLLSDRKDAGALAIAAEFGIPSAVVEDGKPRGRLSPASEASLLAACREAGAEWICLAGFMRILGAGFLGAYPDRVVNIHPSLLPSFPGLDAQGQAFAHGVKVSGCTVHLVDAGVDTGPIVMQRAVGAEGARSADELAARILAVEHELYPAALRRLLEEPWERRGRRIVFTRNTEVGP